MGGANVCTLWVWFWSLWSYEVTTSAFPSVAEVWLSRSKCERSCPLRRFPCPALHWTCYHGVWDCVHTFKRLANQVGYIIVIARVAMDLWQRKQTLSSGCALGLGSFTAINPWPRAITITYSRFAVYTRIMTIIAHYILYVYCMYTTLSYTQHTCRCTEHQLMKQWELETWEVSLPLYS